MFPLRPSTNHELIHLSELTNSATFPNPTAYYNPPSTRYINHQLLFACGAEYNIHSANLSPHLLLQELAPFQLPQMGEEPPQT